MYYSKLVSVSFISKPEGDFHPKQDNIYKYRIIIIFCLKTGELARQKMFGFETTETTYISSLIRLMVIISQITL
jgi:hypothetical protein